jgi:hypothetical protein
MKRKKKKKMMKFMKKQIKMQKKNGRHTGVLSVTSVNRFFHSSHSLIGITVAHMTRNPYIHVHTATRLWRSIPLSGLIVIGMSLKADTGDYFQINSACFILRKLNIK